MRAYLILFAALAIQACASHGSRELLLGQDAHGALTPGEDVSVALNDGSKIGTTVTEVGDDELVTAGGRYPWSDIAYVTHQRVHTVQEDISRVQVLSGAVIGAGLLLVLLLL